MKLIFHLQGRFGNHFYVIAAMLYAIKNNIECNLIMQDYVKDYIKNEYSELHELNNFINKYRINELPDDKDNIVYIYEDNKRDPTISLEKLINKYKNTNKILFLTWSFFQTNKYYLTYTEEVDKLFYYTNDNIRNYANSINDSVFISVRRGDYFNIDYYVMSEYYYIDIYNKHFKGKNIYISSDDINWCKKNLTINKFNGCNSLIYLENLSVIELYSISKYFKNYICSNSTFSSACELSSNYKQNSYAIKNFNHKMYRNHLFSNDCILINLLDKKHEKEYKRYIYKMKTKFDKIYCITVNKNVERQKNIKHIFNEVYKIDFEFIYAFPFGNVTYSDIFKNPNSIPYCVYNDKKDRLFVKYDSGKFLSSTIATYYAVLKAYNEGAKNVLIFEDDICGYKDRSIVEYYLNNIPKDADIVRYGFNLCLDEESTKELIDNNKNNKFMKLDNFFVNVQGAQMYALMNRKTMKICYESIEQTLTGTDYIYNIFKCNNFNLTTYYATTNIALDHLTYKYIKNNQVPPLGYYPFNLKSIKKNINIYIENIVENEET